MTTQVTFIKKTNQLKKGEYKPTNIDKMKKQVEFLLVQTSPYYIRWNNTGEGQIVNARELKKLQANHTWATDF